MIVYPLLALCERALGPGGEPTLVLTTGAVLALVLSIGVSGVVLGSVVAAATALVLGTDPAVSGLARPVLAVAVMGLVGVLLESRRAARGPSPGVAVAELTMLGVILGPAVIVLGETALSLAASSPPPGLDDATSIALAHGLGVLTVMPGTRMLIMRRPLLVDTSDVGVVTMGVGTWLVLAALTLGVGGAAALADAPAAAVPLLFVGFLGGSAVYTVTVTALAVTASAVVAALGLATAGLSPGEHLTWLVIAIGGLLLAAEGDRRRHDRLKLAALFGHAVAASAEVAPSGRVMRVNRAFATMLGWRPEELVDSDLLMLFASDDDGAGVESLIAGHRDEVRGLAQVRTRSGRTRQVRYSGRRLPDPADEDGLLLVQLLDMTDEERRADELQRSNESLARLGSRISHDLKQPLAAIAGYSSTLKIQRDRLDRETIDEMLDRLDLAARRVVDQLDTMVESARVGGDAPESVSIEAVVDAVRGLVDIELREAHGAIETDIGVDSVRTDRRGIQQVLLNLVTNSLKYHDALPPRVRITSRVRGRGVEVIVTDNGTGIPPAHLESVFEPGRRLAPGAAAGRGMGLSDSRRAIEDLGGSLRAEPSAAGARFVLWLPDDDLGVDPSPIRTVVVDCGHRDAGFAVGAGSVEPVHLEDERLHVVGRGRSVSEAVSMAIALEPDVIVVDRWVADGDGMTALASLATAHPPARVVVRTRDGSDHTVSGALLGGATKALDNGADARAVADVVVAVAG